MSPLSNKLWSFALDLRKHFNVKKYDSAEREYRLIYAKAGYSTDRLDATDRARLDELSKQLERQKQPSTARDLAQLFQTHDTERAAEWLRINVSLDYGNEFQSRLESVQNRFFALQFRACQIINGELDSET